jgi:2-keto-4-pentenoate hydratase
MTLDAETHARLGRRLYEAYRTGSPVAPLREEHDLSAADGYAVQRELIERRRADEGDRAGYKVGFTSEAVQQRLGRDEPAFGRLLAGTIQAEGPVPIGGMVDPVIEPEIAFLLGADVPPGAGALEVLAATRAVVPTIEVADCRTADWDITGPEAIADNTLSGRVAHAGRLADPAEVDLAAESVVVRRNGAVAATGTGTDVLGGPVNVVTWLAEALADHGESLSAGDTVITGSMTDIVPLEPGDTIEARFGTLGSVTVHGDGARGDTSTNL